MKFATHHAYPFQRKVKWCQYMTTRYFGGYYDPVTVTIDTISMFSFASGQWRSNLESYQDNRIFKLI